MMASNYNIFSAALKENKRAHIFLHQEEEKEEEIQLKQMCDYNILHKKFTCQKH